MEKKNQNQFQASKLFNPWNQVPIRRNKTTKSQFKLTQPVLITTSRWLKWPISSENEVNRQKTTAASTASPSQEEYSTRLSRQSVSWKKSLKRPSITPLTSRKSEALRSKRQSEKDHKGKTPWLQKYTRKEVSNTPWANWSPWRTTEPTLSPITFLNGEPSAKICLLWETSLWSRNTGQRLSNKSTKIHQN